MEKKVVKLTVAERAILNAGYPVMEDYITFKVIKSLKEQTSFSEDEINALQLRQEGEQVLWKRDIENDFQKELHYGPVGEKVIKSIIEKLHDKKRITEFSIRLYELFVGDVVNKDSFTE